MCMCATSDVRLSRSRSSCSDHAGQVLLVIDWARNAEAQSRYVKPPTLLTSRPQSLRSQQPLVPNLSCDLTAYDSYVPSPQFLHALDPLPRAAISGESAVVDTRQLLCSSPPSPARAPGSCGLASSPAVFIRRSSGQLLHRSTAPRSGSSGPTHGRSGLTSRHGQA